MGFNSGFKGLMKLEFSRQIIEKYSNIKYHKNPSSGYRVVAFGRTDGQTDRQTDRHDQAYFANAHKRGYSVVVVISGVTFVPSLMKNFYLEVGVCAHRQHGDIIRLFVYISFLSRLCFPRFKAKVGRKNFPRLYKVLIKFSFAPQEVYWKEANMLLLLLLLLVLLLLLLLLLLYVLSKVLSSWYFS